MKFVFEYNKMTKRLTAFDLNSGSAKEILSLPATPFAGAPSIVDWDILMSGIYAYGGQMRAVNMTSLSFLEWSCKMRCRARQTEDEYRILYAIDDSEGAEE